MVIVELKSGVPDEGLKLAEAPEGSPEAERETVLLKPLIRETETVAPTELPRCTDPDEGLTLRLKSGEPPPPPPEAFTVSVYTAVRVRLPLVPVTVML